MIQRGPQEYAQHSKRPLSFQIFNKLLESLGIILGIQHAPMVSSISWSSAKVQEGHRIYRR